MELPLTCVVHCPLEILELTVAFYSRVLLWTSAGLRGPHRAALLSSDLSGVPQASTSFSFVCSFALKEEPLATSKVTSTGINQPRLGVPHCPSLLVLLPEK